MSVSGDRRKSLRDRAFGVAGAALAAGVLASCGVAGPGPAGPAASGSCQQPSVLMPGQPGSLIVSSDLDGVAASSAASVWAAGSTSMTDPMTMHWNGSAWTEEVLTLVKGQPGNPPGGFDAVAAVSPDDVWVVGVNAGEPLAEHWNGLVWTVVPTPSPGPQGSGAGAELYGIAAVSARDAWAVGGTTDGATWIIHWDGTAWTRVPSPNPAGINAQLNGVATASAGSAWAVGSYDNPVTDTSLPLIEHWDGRAWTRVPSPNPAGNNAQLNGVATASADSAWAVGSYINPVNRTWRPLIEHWDGRAWTRVPSPNLAGGGTLSAVAALSPASAWAVGTGSLCPGHVQTTLIEHWNGRAWTTVPSPAAGALTGVIETSPDSAWAVGSISSGSGGPAVIEHWNGKTWAWPTGFCGSPSGPGCFQPGTPSAPQ